MVTGLTLELIDHVSSLMCLYLYVTERKNVDRQWPVLSIYKDIPIFLTEIAEQLQNVIL